MRQTVRSMKRKKGAPSYFTVAQIAQDAGITPDSMREWLHDHEAQPDAWAYAGPASYALFTEDSVRQILAERGDK